MRYYAHAAVDGVQYDLQDCVLFKKPGDDKTFYYGLIRNFWQDVYGECWVMVFRLFTWEDVLSLTHYLLKRSKKPLLALWKPQ